MTPDQYLVFDRAQEFKSEYHDGELFAVVAATLRHGRIALRMGAAIESRLKGGPCSAAINPVRVRVSPTKFVYPDVLVVCGEPRFTDEHADTLTNPKVIVEVLSPSTEDYDLGRKFKLYRRLPSFVEYLLVSQDEPRIAVHRRQADDAWKEQETEGLGGVVRVESLGIEIPLAEIYEGITFDAVPME